LGMGIKGQLWENKARCFAMIGNGLGANLYIGGKEHKQFIYANGFGEWKKTKKTYEPDLGDNILLANVQFVF